MAEGTGHTPTILRDLSAPCRDGVSLATDIYLPGPAAAGGGAQWPVILQRTPYGKGGHQAEASWFAAQGYAMAVQDVRGRFGSAGRFEPFRGEAEDGYDTVAWLRRQPWCSGAVGTTGTSYLACTQMALATLRPPGLATQFVSQGFSNYHTTRSRRGGAYENHRTHWLLRMARDSREAQADPAIRAALDQAWDRLEQWISLWPLRPGHNPLAALPDYERSLLDFLTRGDYDEWWHNRGLSLEPYYDEYPDVPLHFLGSWYDPYATAVTDNYTALAGRLRSPVHLLVGPWVHGVEALGWTHAGDVDFGEDARLEYDRLRLAWFDRHLGRPVNIVAVPDRPPVRIFVMGGGSGGRTAAGRLDHGGHWRDEPAWPLSRATPRVLLLAAGGRLTGQTPVALDGGAEMTSYTFDPRDPQPSAPDPRHPAELFPRGGFDLVGHPQSPWCGNSLPMSARHDVLAFCTEPLVRPLEVTGRVEVVLYASSTGLDTDFTARLVDWYPPSAAYPAGYALELCQTILRARYRDSREQPELLNPGQVYRLNLQLPPTSNTFAAGHRLRVDISSSDFPRFDINPNTGEPLGRHRSVAVVRNSVHHSARYPSCVVLPVIEGG